MMHQRFRTRVQSPLRNRRRRLRSGLEPSSGSPEDDKMCWICLSGDEDQHRRDWLFPCRCRGTNKWVHESCLNRWIDEKQLMAPDVPVTCNQCRTEYIIVMPPMCRFDALLERLDKCYERLCPSVLMGILAATVYFSAVTYGALTLLELAGYETGMKLLQEDSTLLMILLPSVPTVLILSRMIHWDDALIRWLRRHNRVSIPADQLDPLGEPLPGAPLDDEYFDQLEREHPPSDSPLGSGFGSESLGRVSTSFCVALSLPTASVVLGKCLFGGVYKENKLMGIIMGGMTFLAIKGLASVYLRQSQYQQRRHRFVRDYAPESVT
ncbi:E3 ubiquitin-protein ligase MARCHF5 [Drosophila eugracilis]|uniref:E3 ubiquitin-protein ligase MARCHF5 n=1 Tax=Drosophila eugracilis TaxID=29029 RepID=UPI0007E7185D|nr:E3 ubiquitin-protein ligase MARCHF5 [Drosophila eugracilis]